jgi:hypothetical protein
MSKEFNYEINERFGEKINIFFEELGLLPINIEVLKLDSQEYDKFIETSSTVSIYSTGADEIKSTTLIQETNNKGYRIYIRMIDRFINLTDTIKAFLRAYLPEVSKDSLEKATPTFELAYRCYDKLFDELALRKFFTSICTSDNNIFVYANLRQSIEQKDLQANKFSSSISNRHPYRAEGLTA